MFSCNLTWADPVWSCWISMAQEPIQSHISRVHFWEPPLCRTVGFATFLLVEISGFFRADINIFNSLLAKQPLKSQAVAFPSCFVELEHILFFGDQVFMEALKFESLLLQIVKGNLRWHGLVDQLFKLFNSPVFIVQQRLYSCQGKWLLRFWCFAHFFRILALFLSFSRLLDWHVFLSCWIKSRSAESRGVRHFGTLGTPNLETCEIYNALMPWSVWNLMRK